MRHLAYIQSSTLLLRDKSAQDPRGSRFHRDALDQLRRTIAAGKPQPSRIGACPIRAYGQRSLLTACPIMLSVA